VPVRIASTVVIGRKSFTLRSVRASSGAETQSLGSSNDPSGTSDAAVAAVHTLKRTARAFVMGHRARYVQSELRRQGIAVSASKLARARVSVAADYDLRSAISRTVVQH
jgi:hypothetical protein